MRASNLQYVQMKMMNSVHQCYIFFGHALHFLLLFIVAEKGRISFSAERASAHFNRVSLVCVPPTQSQIAWSGCLLSGGCLRPSCAGRRRNCWAHSYSHRSLGGRGRAGKFPSPLSALNSHCHAHVILSKEEIAEALSPVNSWVGQAVTFNSVARSVIPEADNIPNNDFLVGFFIKTSLYYIVQVNYHFILVSIIFFQIYACIYIFARLYVGFYIVHSHIPPCCRSQLSLLSRSRWRHLPVP